MITLTEQLKDVEGWLSDAECSVLRLIAGSADNLTVVEIGAWKGKSTICLAGGLRPGSRLFTIDPFDASGEPGSYAEYQKLKGDTPLLSQFRHNLARAHVLDRVTVVVGKSHEAHAEVPEQINILFIDGDHSKTACQADYHYYASRVLPFGLILFHDYYPSRPDFGPTWVVDNLASKEFEKIETCGALWIGRKRSISYVEPSAPWPRA